MKNFVVVGASRGIGAAVAEHLAEQGHQLITVSRSPSTMGRWIKADISTRKGIEAVHSAVDKAVVDGLLYMGGTWETGAFTRDYSFENCSDREMETVIGVNLLAPIRLVQALLPNLRQSTNPKIVFMGSLSGLDNFSGREVANAASKFGLRGVVHALREELRPDNIAVSIINPGNVGTPEVLGDLKEAGKTGDSVIPLPDLLKVLDCILSVSRSTCIKEVQIPAMQDRGA
ncbi:MAG: SDR family oxidoreductase [Cyanobacteria bacterium P01_F01_bin.153]